MTDDQAAELRRAVAHARLTMNDLWVRYFALGGMSTPLELEAYLYGALCPTAHDHNVLVHTLNERLLELGWEPEIPYAED